MNKTFKIGDRVRIIKDSFFVKTNMVGTIIYTSKFNARIRLDKPILCTDGNVIREFVWIGIGDFDYLPKYSNIAE